MESKAINVKLAHRSRMSQIPIYLGKQLRNFIYLNDWKILPTAAVIASLVAIVVRASFFETMEGTILGSFAVAFVCIWNGCFNSIQVVCRERDVIKREHRSGMHISSYIVAIMLYQAMLCLLQTIITVVVLRFSVLHFPTQGFITQWFELDLGITAFLITFAADMLSLFISCIVHNTTTAMTVMPFVLIFLLLFSGSMFSLPDWATSISNYTLSGQGVSCVAALADYNGCYSVTGANILGNIWRNEIKGELPLSTVVSLLQDDTGPLAGFRKMQVNELLSDETIKDLEIVVTAAENVGLVKEGKVDMDTMTLGEVVDMLIGLNDESLYEEIKIPYDFDIFHALQTKERRDQLIQAIQKVTAASMYKPKFEHSQENIQKCWMMLAATAVVFAVLATVSLEFIDNDKR